MWAAHVFSGARYRASINEREPEKENLNHTLWCFHSCSVSKELSLLPVLRFLASHMETESQRHVYVYVYRRMLVFQTQEKEKTSPDFSIPIRTVVYYFWIWIIEFPGLLNIAKSHLQWIGLAPLIESCCEALYCFPHFTAEYFFKKDRRYIFTTNATCRLKRNCCKIFSILVAHCNKSLQNISQPVAHQQEYSLNPVTGFSIKNVPLQSPLSPASPLYSTLSPADTYIWEYVRSHFLGNNCFGLLHTAASQCHCKVSHVTGKGGMRVLLNQLVSTWIISWVHQSLHASAIIWVPCAKCISTWCPISMSYFLS